MSLFNDTLFYIFIIVNKSFEKTKTNSELIAWHTLQSYYIRSGSAVMYNIYVHCTHTVFGAQLFRHRLLLADKYSKGQSEESAAEVDKKKFLALFFILIPTVYG